MLVCITAPFFRYVLSRVSAFSDHAAHKSDTRGEISEGVFSDGITGCLGRLAAKTSGVKKPIERVSLLLFFSLLILKILHHFSKEGELPGSFAGINPHEKDAFMTLEAANVIPSHGIIIT